MTTRQRGQRFIMIDGEPFTVIDVDRHQEGHGVIRVENEDGEEESYAVFDTEERAGNLARESVKEDMLWGIDSSDPAQRASAAANAVEMLGAENLVAWALGMPAGPGSTKVKSLEEWFDLYKETPAEHWNHYDSESESEIERDPDEEEAVVLLGESGWDQLVQRLGFEPTVAYRQD